MTSIPASFRNDFWRGWRALLPLWAGLIPFSLAYAVVARGAGLSILNTQLMSLLVFGGSSQFSAAGLFGVGASGVSIVLTTLLINARHFLYTLTLGQRMKLSWPQKLIGAHLATDEAFGVTLAAASGRELSYGFYLGAALSLFIPWNIATLTGSLASAFVPDPVALGLDFIFPLAFLALLVPLLKTAKESGVALLAGLAAWWGAGFLSSGLVILGVGVLGALLGAWWTQGDSLSADEA